MKSATVYSSYLITLEKEREYDSNQRYKLSDCNSVHSLESSDSWLLIIDTVIGAIINRAINRTVQAVLSMRLNREGTNRICHCTPYNNMYLMTTLLVILYTRASACITYFVFVPCCHPPSKVRNHASWPHISQTPKCLWVLKTLLMDLLNTDTVIGTGYWDRGKSGENTYTINFLTGISDLLYLPTSIPDFKALRQW